MRPRLHIYFALFAGAFLAAVPLVGQTPKVPAKTATSWTPPHTPWGDPDIQGWFINVNEDGTPLERPDRFAGRRLEDVTGEELAAIKRETQQRTIANFSGPCTLLSVGGRTISTWQKELKPGLLWTRPMAKFRPQLPRPNNARPAGFHDARHLR
jgi:hypothetical protein